MKENETVNIESITDVYDLFERKLSEMVEQLPTADKVSVERLAQMPADDYVLKHNKGSLGIFYLGTNYTKREGTAGRSVLLNEDILMSVYAIIRFQDNGLASLDKLKRFGTMPAQYPEMIVDALSGIEVRSTRPVAERKIIPVKTDLLQESSGVWFYVSTFSVPRDYIEKNYRNQ